MQDLLFGNDLTVRGEEVEILEQVVIGNPVRLLVEFQKRGAFVTRYGIVQEPRGQQHRYDHADQDERKPAQGGQQQSFELLRIVHGYLLITVNTTARLERIAANGTRLADSFCRLFLFCGGR